MSNLYSKFISNLTPQKAAAMVMLYGLQMHLHRSPYRHDALFKKILYQSFSTAFLNPQKSAWVTLVVPSEMLIALGLTPIMLESLGGVVGSLGLAEHLLKHAEEIGIPSSLCTFHRIHLAAALRKALPKPCLIAAASALCDGNLRSLQEISNLLDAPFISIDIPEPSAPEAIDYVSEQLEEYFFHTAESLKVHKPLEQLKKTLSVAEETRKWIKEVNKLRKNFYLAKKPLGLAWNFLLHTSRLGDPKTLNYYKMLYHELRKKGIKIPQKKMRFLLMHLLPTYKHKALDMLRQRNVVIVMEEINYITWSEIDINHPFWSLAKKIFSQPMLGQAPSRIKVVNHLCNLYNIDGILHFSHWGCRQSAGAINALKPHLKRPLLNCELDLVDPKSSSEGQIATRMEGFLEMLESYRS